MVSTSGSECSNASVTTNEETPMCPFTGQQHTATKNPDAVAVESPMVLQSKFWYSIALCLQVLFTCWTPIILQVALWNPATQQKENTFLPQTPYIVEFFISVVISNCISLATEGRRGLAQCWDLQGIKILLPVSLLHGTSECLELLSMVWLDGASRAVVSQLKLPIVVLFFGVTAAGRRLPPARYLSALVILAAGVGYILNRGNFLSPAEGVPSSYFRLGLPLGIATMVLSASASLLLDVRTKLQKTTPYFAQAAQLRLATLIVVTLGMVLYAYYTDSIHKIFFQGWTSRVFYLVAWLVLKDYSTWLILKRLAALHLALCSSVALCLTYILDSFIFVQQWQGTQSLLLIIIIALALAIYATTGRTTGNASPCSSRSKGKNTLRSKRAHQDQRASVVLSPQSTASVLEV